jgi:uncharacterized protein (TIGR02611 family)
MKNAYQQLPKRWRKIVVGVAGIPVLIVGIIAIPYPGPGWLIVFAGLGILSTEFPWANRILKYARKKYDAWNEWIKKQNWLVQSLTFIATCAVVIVTIWLLNGYGLIDTWLHLGQRWVHSPLPWFS